VVNPGEESGEWGKIRPAGGYNHGSNIERTNVEDRTSNDELLIRKKEKNKQLKLK
jgi:hypothetical protein